MEKKKKVFQARKILYLVAFFLFLFALFGAWQVYSLDQAHSTFDNYYRFRGCAQLVEKTDTYGICKTDSGATIKIVKYHDKWYLEGDLPCGFLCF